MKYLFILLVLISSSKCDHSNLDNKKEVVARVIDVHREKLGNFYIKLDFNEVGKEDYWFRTERNIKSSPYNVGDKIRIRYHIKYNDNLEILK